MMGHYYTWPSSTNGLTEYASASSFGGLMVGDILGASFDGEIFRMSFQS